MSEQIIEVHLRVTRDLAEEVDEATLASMLGAGAAASVKRKIEEQA